MASDGLLLLSLVPGRSLRGLCYSSGKGTQVLLLSPERQNWKEPLPLPEVLADPRFAAVEFFPVESMFLIPYRMAVVLMLSRIPSFAPAKESALGVEPGTAAVQFVRRACTFDEEQRLARERTSLPWLDSLPLALPSRDPLFGPGVYLQRPSLSSSVALSSPPLALEWPVLPPDEEGVRSSMVAFLLACSDDGTASGDPNPMPLLLSRYVPENFPFATDEEAVVARYGLDVRDAVLADLACSSSLRPTLLVDNLRWHRRTTEHLSLEAGPGRVYDRTCNYYRFSGRRPDREGSDRWIFPSASVASFLWLNAVSPATFSLPPLPPLSPFSWRSPLPLDNLGVGELCLLAAGGGEKSRLFDLLRARAQPERGDFSAETEDNLLALLLLPESWLDSLLGGGGKGRLWARIKEKSARRGPGGELIGLGFGGTESDLVGVCNTLLALLARPDEEDCAAMRKYVESLREKTPLGLALPEANGSGLLRSGEKVYRLPSLGATALYVLCGLRR